MAPPRYTGGCLCAQLRYAADAAPRDAGYCYCVDCRRVSGSGWIGFMGFARAALRFSGATRQYEVRSHRGTTSVRNFCPHCGSLVFGGPADASEFTIYAGSLDEPALFVPRMAIFTRDRPSWAPLPAGLGLHQTLPPG